MPQSSTTVCSTVNMSPSEKYVVDEDAALVILEEMYSKICCEDQTLRTFRRSLSFGHYIKRTLIPLLMSTKREPIIELTMRLLANLTLPVECLYSVEIMSRTEAGRRNIDEISAMLAVTKRSFANVQAMRALVDYMRSILERDTRMSSANCVNINNCVIVLRNVLHIPDIDHTPQIRGNQQSQSTADTTAAASTIKWDCDALIDCAAIQNQILYNLFSLSIDKLLIHLMSCPQREFFAIAMVQVVALMFKDQHIIALQSLLRTWFDASMSDSSEDFESNTTPMKATSGNSSPMLTSDSSDNGGNPMKLTAEAMQTTTTGPQVNGGKDMSTTTTTTANANDDGATDGQTSLQPIKSSVKTVEDTNVIDHIDPGSRKSSLSSNNGTTDSRKKSIFSELSDCGYGTQVESSGRPEIVLTTSSNEDEQPQPMHQHQKPPATNQKQRYNAMNNPRSAIAQNDKREWRRKKLVKRSKTSLINMSGAHHGPTDATISNILKEFTVDFLLKCYGFLVKGLHAQLLTQPDPASDIDTSHLFWLITYFLKLTAQLELDQEHVKHVLSLGIISYLTYEGVSLSEELMLHLGQDGVDKKSCLRRLHLVVTAIKEYLQTLECFKRICHLSGEDKAHLHKLTLQISELTGLQCLFVMLLRNFNAKIHSKQYLQDIIVTNHVLLVLLDEASKNADYRGSVHLKDHIEQFATIEVMQQYGLLLTDYQQNGEFVNDCIFTMMHHIGGDIGQVALLFQPNILKTFSKIFETEYELCDDWSDLIEYIIHKFLNTPQQTALAMPRFSLADPKLFVSSAANNSADTQELILSNCWTKEETDSLYWYYVQSRRTDDIIGTIIKLYAENDQRIKTRIAVIQQLLLQDIITLLEYDDLMAAEDVTTTDCNSKSPRSTCTDESSACPLNGSGYGSMEDGKSGDGHTMITDDIQMLRQRMLNDDKGKTLLWLQKTLIDSCYVKWTLKKMPADVWLHEPGVVMEPIPLHYTLRGQAIPVVPWNSDQSVVHLYPPFMLLLHKLGFHLPADSGKAFVRIPAFWTADILFNVAEKLGPVDRSTLRFDVSDLGNLQDAHSIGTAQAKQTLGGNETNNYAMRRRHVNIRFTPDPLTKYASVNDERRCGDATATVDRTMLMDVVQASEEHSSATGLITIVHHHPIATTTATTTITTTTITTTMTKSLIIAAQSESSDCDSGLSMTMHSASSIGDANKTGGAICLERFPPIGRLPVLQESIDEDNETAAHNVALDVNEVSALGLSVCETASVVSDSTHIYDLYVSDGEEL